MHEYFVIITLALGVAQATSAFTITSESPLTRSDIYSQARMYVADNQRNSSWLNAATLFFSAEPNTIGR
jgi:hypothetical protein